MSEDIKSWADESFLATDANQFISVRLLDHVESCSDEDCYQNTRLAILTSENPVPQPYCSAHAHVVFADWMVGV